MFFAVVSLLALENNPAFSEVWTRLKKIFSRYGLELVERPHISWHVSPVYDMEKLEKNLQGLTQGRRQIRASISGLGVFTGKKPVFYLPVVRSPQVHEIHRTIWAEISPCALNQELYYSPEEWIPHITLNRKAFSCNVGEVFQELCSLDLRCEIWLDNFAVIYRDDAHDGVGTIFPFSEEKSV